MTANAIADDQFRTVVGKMTHIVGQLNQDGGYPFDPEELISFLQLAAEGEFGASKTPIPEVVAAIRKAGGKKHFWKKLEADPELARRVVAFVNGPATEGRLTLEKAAAILGRDFHSLEAAENFFGIHLTDEQRAVYQTVTCPAEVVYQMKGKAVLSPILSLSLMDSFGLPAAQFHPDHQPKPWFGERKQSFSRRLPETGYTFIGKQVKDGSVNVHWDNQQDMVVPLEFIPSTSAVAQAATLHRELSGERMFSDYWARTDDASARGYRVFVLGGPGGLPRRRLGLVRRLLHWGGVGPEVRLEPLALRCLNLLSP